MRVPGSSLRGGQPQALWEDVPAAGGSLELGVGGHQTLPCAPTTTALCVIRPGACSHGPASFPSLVLCTHVWGHPPLQLEVSWTPTRPLFLPDWYLDPGCVSVHCSGVRTWADHSEDTFLGVFWKAGGRGQFLSSRMSPWTSGSSPLFGFGQAYGLCCAGTEIWLLSAHPRQSHPSR